MPRTEWLVPALVAVAAFAGLAWAQPELAAALERAQPPAGLVYAFPLGPVADTSVDVLVVDAAGRHALGLDPVSGITWETEAVGFQATSAAPPEGDGPTWHRPGSGPRFGVEGFNATRLTVFVVDAKGFLVASNAPAADQARFPGGTGAEALPTGLWYLGNGTAPDGAEVPPAADSAVVARVARGLQGLPVGGVATAKTDALAWAYGTLYVTVRIDDLRFAP